MKKIVTICFSLLGFCFFSQTARLSLYEEFTGETCPPCASANPVLNALLASPTNTPKIVAIKWQVPIPSAPTNTWSLYQTNKIEIDWRWKSIASGGYGYSPAISSAPSSKIDGQEATVFGAASGHPANLNSGVISTAQSFTSAFSVTMNRAWDATGTSINLTVSIQATANYTTASSLVFRTVMVERLIQFSVQPGTNGEKNFEDVAIKSFPTLQAGIAMSSNWTIGQTQTFTLNCALPSYVRKKEEVAFVGFIQNDGNQKVLQAVRADKENLTNDAVAIAAKVNVVCSSSIFPEVTIKNNGTAAITALTITPYTDGIIANTTAWMGNIAAGSTATIALNTIQTSTLNGSHTFSFDISAMNGIDFNLTNNTGKVSYLVASNYLGTPVLEDFALNSFPPINWVSVNPNSGSSWSRVTNAGAYNLTPLHSAKYDFFNNTVIGDVDEFYLPPINLSGSAAPVLSFDIAYAQRNANSNDKLDILVSKNCGVTWTNVYSQSGFTLATSLPSAINYVPVDISEWKSETINLTGFNSAGVLVKFVVTNDNGNNMYLDNVNLSQSAPLGFDQLGSDYLNAEIFPNPTQGETSLKINMLKSTSSKITLVNALGQVVFDKSYNLNAGSTILNFNFKEVVNGLYNLIIYTNNGTLVKKVIVSK